MSDTAKELCVSATPDQGSCQESSGTVTCDLGSLDSGAATGVQIEDTTTQAGTVTDTAQNAGTGGRLVHDRHYVDL